MIQDILIVILFTGAFGYLGMIIYRSFKAKSCTTGCSKCGALDLDAIEKQIRLKG